MKTTVNPKSKTKINLEIFLRKRNISIEQWLSEHKIFTQINLVEFIQTNSTAFEISDSFQEKVLSLLSEVPNQPDTSETLVEMPVEIQEPKKKLRKKNSN